jgi:hypothetical protein
LFSFLFFIFSLFLFFSFSLFHFFTFSLFVFSLFSSFLFFLFFLFFFYFLLFPFTLQLQDQFQWYGRCGAVGHRIAPAVDNLLSPAARGEKAYAPHKSTAMNRKRERLIGTPKLDGLHVRSWVSPGHDSAQFRL